MKKLFIPFAIASIPMAFIGGMIEVDASLYKKILGVLLIFAILKMLNVFGPALPSGSWTGSQSHSNSALLFLMCWYHANPRARTVNPIKNGLAGSSHENEAAIPDTLATAAITGTMQHREEAIAAKTPAPINDLFGFLPI